MKRDKQRKFMIGSIGIAIILVLLFIIQTSEIFQVSAVNVSENHQPSKTTEAQLKAETNNTSKEISHTQIVSLTEEFMDILVQDIDNQNKIIQFDTKKELLSAFEKVTIKDVASEYVDYYFHEEKDGLYIRPTETPPWFKPGNDYGTIQKQANIVKVVQNNKTDLSGLYTLKIEFTYNNQWKITNIAYE